MGASASLSKNREQAYQQEKTKNTTKESIILFLTRREKAGREIDKQNV